MEWRWSFKRNTLKCHMPKPRHSKFRSSRKFVSSGESSEDAFGNIKKMPFISFYLIFFGHIFKIFDFILFSKVVECGFGTVSVRIREQVIVRGNQLAKKNIFIISISANKKSKSIKLNPPRSFYAINVLR